MSKIYRILSFIEYHIQSQQKRYNYILLVLSLIIGNVEIFFPNNRIKKETVKAFSQCYWLRSGFTSPGIYMEEKLQQELFYKKKMFLKLSQNSQENIYVGVQFFNKVADIRQLSIFFWPAILIKIFTVYFLILLSGIRKFNMTLEQ